MKMVVLLITMLIILLGITMSVSAVN
ncbi:hypothetical protein LCGC14_2913640, partial [marine sediment metagenome]